MKKNWLTRLEAIEGRTHSLQGDELLDKWISENYPDGFGDPVKYFDLPSIVPKELKGIATNQLKRLLSSMMNTSADLVKHK